MLAQQAEWQWGSEIETVWGLLKEVPFLPDRLDLWVSESSGEREALRQALTQQYPGCQVRVRSAYKPLVHEVLESLLPGWRLGPPQAVHLRYPVVPGEHPERFLLEAYPLAGWLAELGVPLTHEGWESRHYSLVVDGQDAVIEIPSRRARDAVGRSRLRPTGRLDLFTKTERRSYCFLTDAERCWDGYLTWLSEFPWSAQPPFFGTLRITAEVSEPDDPLPYGFERSSMIEGLSEDLYFGTLEFFQHRAGLEPGNRELQPGQIIPVVRACDHAPPRLTIELLPQRQVIVPPSGGGSPPLQDLGRPLRSAEIRTWLRRLEWPLSHGASVQGRPVTACWHPGQGRGVLVTAGQHANEATGVVAALRAAQTLTSPQPLGFIPLENPDGYALFEELRDRAPEHMHHAARYTALGDDLEYRQRPPFYETELRRELFSQLNPVLHLNLHGYPSHEWTRPCSGYVPEGFEAWTLPKGFVLIVRYDPAWAERARELARWVAEDLRKNAALMALNARQLTVYEQHTSARPYDMLQGSPFVFVEKEAMSCPLCLVTEFPDETISGSAFLLGQSAQYQVIERAVQWAEQQALRGSE